MYIFTLVILSGNWKRPRRCFFQFTIKATSFQREDEQTLCATYVQCSLFIQHHSKTHQSIRMNALMLNHTVEVLIKQTTHEFRPICRFCISYLWIKSKVCKRVETKYIFILYTLWFISSKRRSEHKLPIEQWYILMKYLILLIPQMKMKCHQNILHIIRVCNHDNI